MPANVRVPADADDIDARDIERGGRNSRLFGHLAVPKVAANVYLPGVLVVHENRGLVEHIKDVTRRAARAGFIALSVDLLSRQGGVGQFPEATAQTAAYGRTVQWERIQDLDTGPNYDAAAATDAWARAMAFFNKYLRAPRA